MQDLIRELLRAKMGFAALPVCGIFIGLSISRMAPSFEYKLTYEWIGLGVTAACVALFLIVSVVHACAWILMSAWVDPERPRSETIGAKRPRDRRG